MNYVADWVICDIIEIPQNTRNFGEKRARFSSFAKAKDEKRARFSSFAKAKDDVFLNSGVDEGLAVI